MLFKKILLYHLIPALIGVLITLAFIRAYKQPAPDLNFSASTVKQTIHVLDFKPYDLTNQVAFSLALKQRIPVVMGSSELTSVHLEGLAHNFFNKNRPKDRLLSVGHAGFQCLGILTTLAANRELLKDSKITIILSPGWFEEQYCKGISLSSFFEIAAPNYMYQIANDAGIDAQTKEHLRKYISANFDKISKPDASLRIMGKKNDSPLNIFANAPFTAYNQAENKKRAEQELYLGSQELILKTLRETTIAPYVFYPRTVDWDSLFQDSRNKFKTISTTNSISVENGYYDSWLKGKDKKKIVAVDKENNQEYKDLEALVHFLNDVGCKPLFVIMPLNTKAHDHLEKLKPTIEDVKSVLSKGNFKTLDMFSPNLENYQDGVLEDIMHPYNLGWYQIDKFILENYHD